MRILLGPGAMGQIVKSVQSNLNEAGFDTRGTDGFFGQATASAVRSFQESRAIEPSGVVDDGTWEPLMKSPVPPVSDRCLQLTAAFEGHGFGLAMGNFDGALLTWGIIGFTMASGEVQNILLSVNTNSPSCIQEAFGQSAEELVSLMKAPRTAQVAWANAHTVSKRGLLAEPWRSMFASLGEFPEVQSEQIKRVRSDYLDPAISTAKKLAMSSELALALCFDIHVQNGGIKAAALNQLLKASAKSEIEMRVAVANAVAAAANAKWQEDVRRRKLAIANGGGVVHGHNYVLDDWGLSGQIAATELSALVGKGP